MSQQKKNIFLDGSLFNHRWFDKMRPLFQLAYIILWLETNNIGIWNPNFRLLNFKLKEVLDQEAFLEEVNSEKVRIEVLGPNRWWLREYLPFQVKTLTPKHPAHISYIEQLHGEGLLIRYAVEEPDSVNFEEVYKLEGWAQVGEKNEKEKKRATYLNLQNKGLVRPLKESCEAQRRASEGYKEKETDKDKDKEKDNREESGQGHPPTKLVKDIADEICRYPGESKQELYTDIQQLAHDLRERTDCENPLDLIKTTLSGLLEFNTKSEVDINFLRREVIETYTTNKNGH